jgi:hypothetical protein
MVYGKEHDAKKYNDYADTAAASILGQRPALSQQERWELLAMAQAAKETITDFTDEQSQKKLRTIRGSRLLVPEIKQLMCQRLLTYRDTQPGSFNSIAAESALETFFAWHTVMKTERGRETRYVNREAWAECRIESKAAKRGAMEEEQSRQGQTSAQAATTASDGIASSK